MLPSRLLRLLAVSTTLGLAACAGPYHHHGPGAAPGPATLPMAGPGGPMARMDAQMAAMRAMHERVARAGTPQERDALMAEHHKLMQEGVGMMGGMGPGGAGGMMGGLHGPGAGPLAGEPAARQQWMEKRMEMMQSMMQMMLDRLPPSPAKP